MVWPAVAAVGAQIVGGLLGQEAASGARGASQAAYEAALREIQSLKIPEVEKQQLILQLPQIVGEYEARLEQEGRTLGPSSMQGIQTDAQLKAAQRKALENLSRIGEEGLLPGERAELRQARREAAQMDQARQQAVLQEMAARGMSGGGSELIAKLKSGQAAADRASSESDRLMSMAQRRALEAIGASGSMATQLRGQEFGEEAQKAQAADLIAKFNLENAQELARRNIERQNQAALRNLTEKQRIAEQQVLLRNQQQQYNKQLLQQQFENQYKKAAALAGAQQQMGQFHAGEASRIGGMYAGIAQGVGQGISAIGAHNYQQARDAKADAFQKDYLEILRGNKPKDVPTPITTPVTTPATNVNIYGPDSDWWNK